MMNGSVGYSVAVTVTVLGRKRFAFGPLEVISLAFEIEKGDILTRKHSRSTVRKTDTTQAITRTKLAEEAASDQEAIKSAGFRLVMSRCRLCLLEGSTFLPRR
jgi:hypothetical protein